MKPLDQFGRRTGPNTRGYTSWCKTCEKNRSTQRRTNPEQLEYHRRKSREWQRSHRVESNSMTREWRKRNPTRLAALKRKWRYGLEPHEVEALLIQQDGQCAICRTDIRDVFHVDHDHTTRRVRGLLCNACNWGLGHFRDSEAALLAAVNYLRLHQLKT